MIDAFIKRWQASAASERANYQLFLTELCAVLEVEPPQPAGAEEALNTYVFEKSVRFPNRDGSFSLGRIDLYKRGFFVLEAKQGANDGDAKPGHGIRGSEGWAPSMVRAKNQAEKYVRALPAAAPTQAVLDVPSSVSQTNEPMNSRTNELLPLPWPASLADQIALVRGVNHQTAWQPADGAKSLVSRFSGVRAPTLQRLIDALAALGHVG